MVLCLYCKLPQVLYITDYLLFITVRVSSGKWKYSLSISNKGHSQQIINNIGDRRTKKPNRENYYFGKMKEIFYYLDHLLSPNLLPVPPFDHTLHEANIQRLRNRLQGSVSL